MTKICLVIIDGFGLSENEKGNAANKSHFINYLMTKNDYLEIFASGEYVGLPCGNSGNSEVGHMAIGTGRVVYQSLLMIENAFRSGELKSQILKILNKSKNIHLFGMISDGGIHSHLDHLKYLIECVPKEYNVFVHAIADGIDVPPHTFKKFLSSFDNIVSISGRYYAMDRDNNEERTEKVFKMFTTPINDECDNIIDKISLNNIADEYIEPSLLKNHPILPEDTVILFNFRADRMKQIYQKLKNYCTVYTITEYEDNDPNAIIKKQIVENTLPEVLSKNNKTQSHIAETEKYAHVTYFLNGGREKQHENEKWVLVPSPKVDNFTLAPETSMEKVTDKCIEDINNNIDFIVINLAGPDLVGHTGDYDKTVISVQVMDDQIKRIYDKAIENDYVLIITSDHGNSEQMILNGEVCKSHTSNKVLFMILNSEKSIISKRKASLIDIAPTVLKLMAIEFPSEMTGKPLIE